VELQLCHSPEVKASIDNAWGVVHNKHKKNQAPAVSLDPNDPKSQEHLQLIPIGQDSLRKRYWVADGLCTIPLRCFFPICVYLRWHNRIICLPPPAYIPLSILFVNGFN